MMRHLSSTQEPPWIIAHRGASADYPENSLAAFRAAGNLPEVDAIEMDVQLSRDGVPVVFHDETLQRMGHSDERMADCDWAVLRGVDVGSWFDARFASETMPALSDALAALPQQTLCIELKVYPSTDGEALARRAVETIVAQQAVNRVLILSFDHHVLNVVRSSCPEVRIVGLFRQVPSDPSAVDPFDAVDISIRRATAEFVAQARERARPVIVYTCNNEADVAWAQSVGVNAITTDRPAWLAGLQ